MSVWCCMLVYGTFGESKMNPVNKRLIKDIVKILLTLDHHKLFDLKKSIELWVYQMNARNNGRNER